MKETFSRFLADDGRLEFGQQHTGAEDEFQRLSGTRPVGDFAVDGERVIHRHHFVVFCFHEFIELNYSIEVVCAGVAVRGTLFLDMHGKDSANYRISCRFGEKNFLRTFS